jgi:2-oxo-4-hydroxy-4-carboxy-5-ureidoimidazoline decarboxylase
MNPHTLANEDKEKYLNSFNELYEHSPWVIEFSYEKVKKEKKYDELVSFHKLLSKTVLDAQSELQNSLIKAHPMLAGKKAKANELTDFSTDEQKSAGLNSCSDEEIELFDTLNKNYFEKFDFPFIMAVKGSTKEEILESFKKRLENSLFSERIEALNQINKIAWIRIKDIYEQD